MSRPKILAFASLKPAEMHDRLLADYDVLHDIDRAADVRIVLTSGAAGLSGAQMVRLPALELTAVNGVGVDAVDLTEARRRGIRVTTTPDVLSSPSSKWRLALRWPLDAASPRATALSGPGHAPQAISPRSGGP